jgi:myo-inositol-1(or 4)-monophosphatase
MIVRILNQRNAMLTKSPDFILHSIMDTARHVGEIIRESTVDERINIGTDDMVTIKDLEADSLITVMLQKDFPDTQICTEEASKTDPDYSSANFGNFTGFFVDPIDGSVNFSRTTCEGYGNYAVSIGYCEKGIPIAGCIYKPSENEMFHAVKGKGAFQDGIPIRVSEIDSLNLACIEVGSFWIREEMDLFKRWFTNPSIDVNQILIRGSAASALADVARGRIEAMFHARLNPWDYAAGWLIIEEAGGVVMDYNTDQMKMGSKYIYATNKALNETIAAIIRGK